MSLNRDFEEDDKAVIDTLFQAMVGTVGLKKTMDIYSHYNELRECVNDDVSGVYTDNR